MFGSSIKQSARDNLTNAGTIPPTDTGFPIAGLKNAVDLIGSTGEVKATPIRQPAHAFFNINSIDRYASAAQPVAQFALITKNTQELGNKPASNFNMSLQRNLLSGYFHRLTVTETNLQWNIPTINSQNYVFSMNVRDISGAGGFESVNISLTPDFYTYTELATELQIRIIAAFGATAIPTPSLSVTWSPSAGGSSGYCFKFETNNPDLQISFNSVLEPSAVLIPGQTQAQGNRALLKLYTMLGITSPIMYTYENDVVVSYPSYPTLIYTSYIDIISNKLSQFMRVKDSETAFQPDTSVITRVYLSTVNGISAPILSQTGTTTFDTFAIGSRPFVLNYSPITVKNINWSPGQSIIDFNIRVVDEFGDLVPWNLANTNPVDNTAFFSEFFEFQLTTIASES